MQQMQLAKLCWRRSFASGRTTDHLIDCVASKEVLIDRLEFRTTSQAAVVLIPLSSGPYLLNLYRIVGKSKDRIVKCLSMPIANSSEDVSLSLTHLFCDADAKVLQVWINFGAKVFEAVLAHSTCAAFKLEENASDTGAPPSH